MPIVSLRRLAAVLPAAALLVGAMEACGLDGGGASDGDAPGADGGLDVARVQDTSIPPADVQTPPDDDVGVPVDDGSALDASADDVNVPDAPPPEACASPTESCGDGVDNDCNGLIDCADPACGAFACTPSAPTGWTLIELAAATRPDCDPNFTSPVNTVEGVGGPPHQCTCPCTINTQSSCVHGSLNVFSTNSTLGCPLIPFQLDTGDGACQPISNGGLDSVPGGKASIAPLPFTAGTCTATVNKVPSPITVTARGRMCSLQSPAAGGCAAGNTCAPKPSAAYGLCVAKSGDQACPQGFPTKHLAGTGVTDTRTCGACNSPCTVTGSCSNPQLNDYEDGNCDATKGKVLGVPVDGMCEANNETTSTRYKAFKYSADVTQQCNGGTSTPSGSVTASGVTTICCP